MSDIKSGALSVPTLTKNNTTAFTWDPKATEYWSGHENVPSLEERKQISQSMNPIGVKAGMGSTLKTHPMQLKEAVKGMITMKENTTPNSLTQKAKAAYDRRKSILDKQGPMATAFEEVAGVFDKASEFGGKLIEGDVAQNRGRETLVETEDVLTQKINDLMTQAQQESYGGLATGGAAAKYALARDMMDSLMEAKINNMSNTEIRDFDTLHPVLRNLTSTLAVGTVQFVALRNAPFLGALGDTLMAKAATKLAPVVKAGKISKTLAKLATETAGELPASFVMPVMNFDFERRPLTELPAQVLTDLSLIIPTAIVGHGVIRLGSAATKAAATALTSSVIKASTKIAAMARSLRIPLAPGADKALEQAVMNESQNAFSQILNVFPEERMVLQNFFEQQRFSAEGENRMLNLEQSPDISMGENRLAGKTGPKKPEPQKSPMGPVDFTTPSVSDTQIENAAKGADDILRGRATEGEIVRTELAISDLETKLEFERMVGEMRQFREGAKQGTQMTRESIQQMQTRMEDFITESLDPKYRSRALPLIKRATTPERLAAAVERLNEIVNKVEIAELKLGAERGSVRRQARAQIKEMLATPEVEPVGPFRYSVWMQDTLRSFGLDTDVINKFLTDTATSTYDQFTPVKNLPKTWNLMKQFVKVTEAEKKVLGQIADEIYVGNFETPAQVRAFNRYAYLKAFKERLAEGHTNGFSKELDIPNNPSMEWLDAEIARMQTPQLEAVNAQKNKFFQTVLDDMVEAKQVDPATAAEWKAKRPNYLSFFYEKYLQTAGEGNPNNTKTWNFKDSNQTKAITGGSGLEVSGNLYNTMRKAADNAVNNKWMNRISQSLRDEMGVKPLQVLEDGKGGREFQAVIDGQVERFDAKDLEADLVPSLKGQRVMYSEFDGQAFLVPKEISDMIQGVGKGGELDPVSQKTAVFSRAWSYMTTTARTSFLIANPTRDLQTGLRFTKHPMTSFLSSYVKSGLDVFAGLINPTAAKGEILMQMDDGMAKAVKGNFQKALDTITDIMAGEGWEKRLATFREGGGTQGTFMSELRTNVNGVKEYQLAAVDPKFNQSWMANPVVRLPTGAIAARFSNVASLSQALEEIARKAEFELTLKETGGDIIQAGADAADVTLDFRSKGSSPVIRVAQVNMPYSYTALKGGIRKWNLLTGGQKVYKPGTGGETRNMTASEVLARVVAPTIPLAITSYIINKMTGASNYVGAYLQKGYIPVHTGLNYEDEFGNTNPIFFTMRMDEISASAMAVTNLAIDHWIDQNPEAWNKFKSNELSISQPSKFAITKLPPYMRLWFEIPANFSFYREEPINKPGMEKKPVELRKFQSTTPPGEALGEALGIGGNQGDYILQELAPAIFDDIKLLMKTRGGKPDWMVIGEYLKLLQTPNAYFADSTLDMERQKLGEELRAGYRDANASEEDVAKFEGRIQQQIDAIDGILQYREDAKAGKPLKGITVKFQDPAAEIDMDKVQSVLNSPAGNVRKAMFNTLSEQEKQALRSLLSTSQ